jgi:hypothetical protein
VVEEDGGEGYVLRGDGAAVLDGWMDGLFCWGYGDGDGYGYGYESLEICLHNAITPSPHPTTNPQIHLTPLLSAHS